MCSITMQRGFMGLIKNNIAEPLAEMSEAFVRKAAGCMAFFGRNMSLYSSQNCDIVIKKEAFVVRRICYGEKYWE